MVHFYFALLVHFTFAFDINPSKTFYSLRHSFIDALKQSDQNIEHIQAFVGHSHNAKTTFGYGSPLNTKLLKGLLEHINY